MRFQCCSAATNSAFLNPHPVKSVRFQKTPLGGEAGADLLEERFRVKVTVTGIAWLLCGALSKK